MALPLPKGLVRTKEDLLDDAAELKGAGLKQVAGILTDLSSSALPMDDLSFCPYTPDVAANQRACVLWSNQPAPLIVVRAIIAPQKSISTSAAPVNLMQAARSGTERFVSPALKVLKMQIHLPVRIGRKVVRGKR